MVLRSSKSNDADDRLSDENQNVGLLVRYALRAFTQGLQRAAAEHGVTAAEFRVLRTLSSSNGMTQSELARLASLDRPYVAALLKQLEAADLVERTRNSTDTRRVDLSLTTTGIRKLRLVDKKVDMLNKVAVEGISDRDVSTFVDVIGRMRLNVERFQVAELDK